MASDSQGCEGQGADPPNKHSRSPVGHKGEARGLWGHQERGGDPTVASLPSTRAVDTTAPTGSHPPVKAPAGVVSAGPPAASLPSDMGRSPRTTAARPVSRHTKLWVPRAGATQAEALCMKRQPVRTLTHHLRATNCGRCTLTPPPKQPKVGPTAHYPSQLVCCPNTLQLPGALQGHAPPTCRTNEHSTHPAAALVSQLEVHTRHPPTKCAHTAATSRFAHRAGPTKPVHTLSTHQLVPAAALGAEQGGN
jgi:hypothetical protein